MENRKIENLNLYLTEHEKGYSRFPLTKAESQLRFIIQENTL